MAKRAQASESSSPNGLQWGTLIGVILVGVLGVNNYATIKNLKELESRMASIDARMSKMQTDVAAAAARPAQPQRRGPDPNQAYTLKPAPASMGHGNPSAPITIVEVSDFQCPFCSRVGPTLKQIEQVYKDDVRFVWKHFPLDFHKDAPLAHLASVAAGEQGKFTEMRDKLFANQQKLKRDDLIGYARDLKLDVKKFTQDIDSKAGQPIIDADMAELKALGISGTPGFFVNGKFLSGAKPFDEFAKAINAELTKLGKPIPAGAQGG